MLRLRLCAYRRLGCSLHKLQVKVYGLRYLSTYGCKKSSLMHGEGEACNRSQVILVERSVGCEILYRLLLIFAVGAFVEGIDLAAIGAVFQYVRR